MSTENPLKVIGIAPEALQHTTLDQAARLVDTMAKARLRQEHPDAGGDAARFQAIQEAKRALENRETLRRAVAAAQEPRRTRIAKLEQELHDAAQARQRAETRATAFMSAAAGAGSGLNIYNSSLTIRLRDVLRAAQVHTMHHSAQQQLFVTLTTSAGQIVSSDRAGKQRPRQNRLIGCLHQQDVPEDFSQAIDFVLACRPTAAHQALPGQAPAATASSSGNFLSWNRAAPLLSLLRPELRMGAIVFSYRDSDEPGLLLEGQFIDAKAADPP